MSPYIVTTRRPEGYYRDLPPKVVSRRAVATLEEAFNGVPDATRNAFGLLDALLALTESGGTVGPLPDGTVIEVEALSWADLRERAGLDRDGLTLDCVTLETFNARQS